MFVAQFLQAIRKVVRIESSRCQSRRFDRERLRPGGQCASGRLSTMQGSCDSPAQSGTVIVARPRHLVASSHATYTPNRLADTRCAIDAVAGHLVDPNSRVLAAGRTDFCNIQEAPFSVTPPRWANGLAALSGNSCRASMSAESRASLRLLRCESGEEFDAAELRLAAPDHCPSRLGVTRLRALSWWILQKSVRTAAATPGIGIDEMAA